MVHTCASLCVVSAVWRTVTTSSSESSTTSEQLLTTGGPSSEPSGDVTGRSARVEVRGHMKPAKSVNVYTWNNNENNKIIDCLTVCVLSDMLSVQEYRSLLQLLCPDFPVEMVQNTARCERTLQHLYIFCCVCLFFRICSSFLSHCQTLTKRNWGFSHIKAHRENHWFYLTDFVVG